MVERREPELGDGADLGMRIEYAIQPSPDGLAQAFIIGEEFIGDESVALVLGDNIFHGAGLGSSLRTNGDLEGGLIFVAAPALLWTSLQRLLHPVPIEQPGIGLAL